MKDSGAELLKKWWDRDKVPVVLGSRSSDLEDINAAIQLMLEDYGTVMAGDDLAILNRNTVPKKLTSIEEGDIYKPMEKEASMQRKTAESILTIRRKVAALEGDIRSLVVIGRQKNNVFMKKEANKGLAKLMLALGLLGTGGFLGAKSGAEALTPNSGSPLRELSNKLGATDATPMEDSSDLIAKRRADLEAMIQSGELTEADRATGLKNIQEEVADMANQKKFLASEEQRFAAEDAQEEAKRKAIEHHNTRQAGKTEDEYLAGLRNIQY